MQGEVASITVNQVIDRIQTALVDKLSMMEAKLTTSLEKQAEMKGPVDALVTDIKVLKEKNCVS